MSAASNILVIAATGRELAADLPCHTLVCGVGPVDAAARSAAAIAALRPTAVLHVGIAGARRASGLTHGAMVIGSVARYTDLTVPPKYAPNALVPDAALLAAVSRAFPDAPNLPIATTAQVGGSVGCEVEAMEGFSVLRAAALAGVPAIEVRVISNEIEESDRSKWAFDLAFAAVTAATPRLVDAIANA
jgi:futalosine hydrolase